MRIHILSFGTLRLNELEMTGQGSADSWLQFPSYGVLIEHEKGLILVDTGCEMDPCFPDRIDTKLITYSDADTVSSRLAELDFTPDDIDYVIITHMHVDHAGDLQLFKNATFITAREEYLSAIIDTTSPAPKGLIGEWRNPYRKWSFTDRGITDFAGDIQLINFGPGHSFCMLAVLLKTQNVGDILIASDIVYNQYTLNGLLPGNVVNIGGFKESVMRINELADHGTTIWFGHDTDQFASMRQSPNGFYE